MGHPLYLRSSLRVVLRASTGKITVPVTAPLLRRNRQQPGVGTTTMDGYILPATPPPKAWGKT
jgi:hypothetical protein